MSVEFPLAIALESAPPLEAEAPGEGSGDRPREDVVWESQLTEAKASDAQRPRPTPATQPDGEVETILVVEDEVAIRDYLESLFQDRFSILSTGDGRDGLDIARDRHPDLMLLDFMLPGMDGLEVCRQLRADADARDIKVLMLTARTDEEVKLQALDYGADDFLTKPFSPAEVRTRVRNLLATGALETRLRARNSELTDTLGQLRSSQQQLVQSEKINALGHLSAGLLHEVNNPLNYTNTALDFAKTLPVVKSDEMLVEIVSDIEEGMQRITAIVSDLRAFAYPSEAARRAPFGLRAAVDKAVRFTAHDTRGLTVDNALDPELTVEASESHIVQVLVNLITNAVKAIDARDDDTPGRIGFTVESRGERVLLRVSDNGIGMDAKALSQCQDPFYTTRDVGEGMGMGLSICRTIITEHGGDLQVESEPGVGTAFSFDLTIA